MDLRLVLPLVLVAGGTVVAFAGASPQAALGPADALVAEEGPVAVKGMVVDLDEANRTFVLTDGEARLSVRLATPLPAALVEQASLVAKGLLVQTWAGPVLEADAVLLGCPSKYA